MRVGELKHLTWDDVDFLRGVILIQEKVGWKPKTGDQRAIPMSPAARAVLESFPRKAQWVFTAAPSRRYPKGDHQVSERRLLDYLKRVLKRLGFKGHVHTFRHAFISNALTQGIPEAIVRQWVGHVDPEVIKLYTHIADQASQAAMRRLAEAGNQTPAQAGKEAKNERMEVQRIKHGLSTRTRRAKMARAQNESRQPVRATAYWTNGEGGIRLSPHRKSLPQGGFRTQVQRTKKLASCHA